MLKFRKYVCPSDPEEAWKLNQAKSNVILGGTGWLKMGSRQWATAIDLSALGLDSIEEDGNEFRIGATVTLRQMELHPGLNAYTNHAVRECVRHIVGVQFRNCATVGGTFWGRYGFSDVLTCFLALDTEVELYKGGRVPLAEFAQMKPDRDLLLRVIVKKTPAEPAYESFRNTETDFPVLAVAVNRTESGWRAAIGARPGRAVLVAAETPDELLQAADGLTYGTNTRAGGEYRRHLAQVLLKRSIQRMGGGEHA